MNKELITKVVEFKNELLKLKEKENFKKYGFAPAWDSFPWLKKVNELRDGFPLSSEENNFIGILQSLALKYAYLKGKETDSTKNHLNLESF